MQVQHVFLILHEQVVGEIMVRLTPSSSFLVILVQFSIIVKGCSSRSKPVKKELPSPSEQITCKDENGHPVEWFIVYKQAKLRESSNNLVKNGLSYVYLKPGLDTWAFSQRSIGDSESIVGRSLKPLYEHETFSDNRLRLLFNDQPPNRPSVNINGHTKGLMIADEFGGIWLQHSVPKFPSLSLGSSSKYEYPPTGTTNAQILFCMTLNASAIENVVANVLLHVKPAVYNHTIPASLRFYYQNVLRLASKGKKRHRDPSKIFHLEVGDLHLTVFAKGPKFEQEIYGDWIAPTVDSSLRVQSWLNGVHPMKSNCQSPKYQILNISEKQLDKNISFSSGKDHSKWAISDSGQWTCIADLNRMERQKARGGTALCTTNENIWKSFDKSVLDIQPCEKNQRY